jgi:hypothetical protein
MEVTGNAVKLAPASTRAKGAGPICERLRGTVPVRGLHVVKPEGVWFHSE